MNPQTAPYTGQKPSKLPLIIVSLLLIVALVFGIWAYGQMQDYKSNSDKKTAAAVAAAQKQQSQKDKADYDEQTKSPYATYKGSPTYGSVSFNYPKSWNAYDASDANAQPINAYFYNGIVPKVESEATYPLRVELLGTEYNDAIQQFSSQVTDGKLKASAYIPPKMKGVANVQAGTRFEGELGPNGSGTKQGAVVIMKVRDKTLQISTETKEGVKDLDDIVLASLTYVP